MGSHVATVVAIVALYYSGRGAHVAAAQITQQAELFREAAQPVLRADIRGDVTGQLLALLVGKSGPSIAHNVKVNFEPAPPQRWTLSGPRSVEAKPRRDGTGANDGVGAGCGS
jgi:hypothetical protein